MVWLPLLSQWTSLDKSGQSLSSTSLDGIWYLAQVEEDSDLETEDEGEAARKPSRRAPAEAAGNLMLGEVIGTDLPEHSDDEDEDGAGVSVTHLALNVLDIPVLCFTAAVWSLIYADQNF